MSQRRYENKVAVITGGGSGLGRDMALAFAREGAQICVIGRRQEKLDETCGLIEKEGGKAFGLSADVRDPARIEAVMKEIVERAGRIDVLVNNAAGNFVAPSEELSPNGFKSVIDIVLLGTFYCTRFAFGALKESKGAILNIIAAYAWSGEPGAVHSASAKAGVLAMTRTLAGEWGRYGIRSNAIAPGPIHTEGHRQEPLVRRERRGDDAQVDSDGPHRRTGRRLAGRHLDLFRRSQLGERRHSGGRRRAVAARRHAQLPRSLRLGQSEDDVMSIDFSHAPHAWEKERGDFVALLDLQLVSIDRGKAVMRMPFRQEITNGTGAVHGGAIVSLCDTVFYVALASIYGREQRPPRSRCNATFSRRPFRRTI